MDKHNVLQRMSKTPMELDVSGHIYKLAPLELRHLAELESWAERQPFVRLKTKFDAIEGVPISDAARDTMVAEADRISSDPILRLEEVQSFVGIMKALRLSLSIHHPKLNDKEFNQILKAYPVQRLKEMLDDLTDIPEDEAKN